MVAIVTGVRWNHNVVFTCISLMAKNVDHFFIYSLDCWSFVLLLNGKNYMCISRKKIYPESTSFVEPEGPEHPLSDLALTYTMPGALLCFVGI
jgi:hypothetical protein